MRSVLSDEKKLSIAALSQTLPERLYVRGVCLSFHTTNTRNMRLRSR